uniref:Uncharacterized protein n=1 Tax=Phasianus colchicus TaxID=9054 RepID=A0A669Q0C4_PHACC
MLKLDGFLLSLPGCAGNPLRNALQVSSLHISQSEIDSQWLVISLCSYHCNILCHFPLKSALFCLLLQVTESFLSKEVSYVVSSKKEAKRSRARAWAEKRGNVTAKDTKAQSSTPSSSKENHTRPQQKPPDTALISRGRELLQKAMKNQVSSTWPGFP